MAVIIPTKHIATNWEGDINMEIAVIGSGYVGLVAAACFAELGHETVCVDNDRHKIAALQRGEIPIHEELLPILLHRHAGTRLRFTTSVEEAVNKSSIIFLAVGTPPSDTGEADLSGLENVCIELAAHINNFKLVVVKSTVPVGTKKWIARVLQRNGADAQSFRVASNPEFLRESTAVTDFLYPDRIVLGCDCERSSRLLQQVYLPLLTGSYAQNRDAIPFGEASVVPPELVLTSSASAELIKHASNAFLAMKVSFINAVANICEANDADITEVVRGIGSDRRIGGKFLKPGIGYGGSCFPKDLDALYTVAKRSGYDFRLLEEVMQINEDQRSSFISKVRQAVWPLKGKRLAVLGLAFKGGTDDVRESPAIAVVRALLKEDCSIAAYDPAAGRRAAAELPHLANIQFVESAYEAAAEADALLILTDWDEFASLDLHLLRDKLRQPVVIDGRNLYSLEEMEAAGFFYTSIGRPQTSNSGAAISSRDAAA